MHKLRYQQQFLYILKQPQNTVSQIITKDVVLTRQILNNTENNMDHIKSYTKIVVIGNIF